MVASGWRSPRSPSSSAGCGDKGGAGKAAPAAGRRRAEVGVVTVALRPVGLVTELPGRLEASRVAQVRARVAGIVLKRLFVEGSDVKAGQPLFQIDSASLPGDASPARRRRSPGRRRT